MNRQCGDCRHLRSSPAELERAIPGLTSMGSAYSSVRAGDGLCDVHGRYVSRTHRCQRFEERSAAVQLA